MLFLPANQVVDEQTTINLNATATDSDVPTNSLTFALVSGPSGLTVSTNGAISWMPTELQGPSTNTVFISVTDTNAAAVNATSLSTTNSFQIIVNEVNVAPVLFLPPNTNINEQVAYSATATATDADFPANALNFALVSGPSGLTVSSAGVINWTPAEDQGPSTNTVTITVTDSNPLAVNATSLSVTNSCQIIVSELNVAPVLGTLTNHAVNAGQTVSFTATATDSDVPTNTLTFSLVSPPAGASINSGSGLFSWRPAVSLANTTNTVQVQVTDFNPFAVNSQHLSDTKSFTVIVNPLATQSLASVSYTNGQFALQVSGTSGPDYIISASADLTQWVDLFTNQSGVTPFQFTDTNANSFLDRFYRIRLSP